MTHIVLLGDSTFDNGVYVPEGPSVIEQLLARLEPEGDATMLAVDGYTVENVHGQIQWVPQEATHIMVSVGGNDALGVRWMLDSGISSVKEFMENMVKIQRLFRREYARLLVTLRELEKHMAVCTIYDAVPSIKPFEATALSMFNDVILRQAVVMGAPVIDLRLICCNPEDFSEVSDIEPSSIGGAKIMDAIVRVCEEHDFDKGETVVYK